MERRISSWVAVISLTTSFVAFAGDPICHEILLDPNPKASVRERRKEIAELYKKPPAGKNSEAITEIVVDDLRRQSAKLKVKLHENPDDVALRTYDVIYVGAGIHSAVVKAAFNETLGAGVGAPRILTVEATNQVSVFGRTGKAFKGNTLEHPDLGKPGVHLSDKELRDGSRNYLPNGPVQVSDVASVPDPDAIKFQEGAVAAHWSEGGDFLFKEPVVSYEKITSGPQAGLYKTTLNGETFYAHDIVLTTGLGEAKLPTSDPKSVEFIRAEQASGNSHVIFVEDLLESAQNQAERGVNFTKKFGGKHVMIVGGGHGGAIGLEVVEGMGPELLYAKFGGKAAVHKPAGYLWVNLKANTGDEFKSVIGGGNRYFPIAPLIDEKRVLTNQFYIHEILPGKNGPVRVSYLDKSTKKPVVDAAGNVVYTEVDYVIYAVGYSGVNSKLAKGFENGRFEPVAGITNPADQRFVHDREVTIGTQLYSGDGTAENVYAAGPSAGQIADVKDPGGPSSVTMNTFNARSEALGKMLAKKYANRKAPIH